MKMLLKSAIAVAALTVPSLAMAAEYVFDPAHTTAQFSVKHLMVTNVRGEFSKVSGKLNIDDKDVTKSSVEVTIDASTIDTREPNRDNHLRSPDFFDVAKYPAITFKSTKVEKAGDKKLKVTGDLTIHGVTKQAVLDVDGPTPEIKHPAVPEMRRGASATTKISRKDYGLTWNQALEAGGVAVGDEVTVYLEIEALRKLPAQGTAKDGK
jgi:polyisoprenoid-binding protein YceI